MVEPLLRDAFFVRLVFFIHNFYVVWVLVKRVLEQTGTMQGALMVKHGSEVLLLTSRGFQSVFELGFHQLHSLPGELEIMLEELLYSDCFTEVWEMRWRGLCFLG